MVFENITDNVLNGASLDFSSLPPEIISRIGGLITILKAAGIIFIGYLVFLVIRWILTFKRYRLVRQMDKKIDEMDKKLDLLLSHKKMVVEEKTEKKKIDKKEKKKKRK